MRLPEGGRRFSEVSAAHPPIEEARQQTNLAEKEVKKTGADGC